MFYGRIQELSDLNQAYESKQAELIILYGRRRIGKTELLKKFIEDKCSIFYSCRECTDKEQLKLFSRKLLNNSPMSKYMESFNDWEDAFRFIKDVNTKGKSVVIIDEFPYMVNSNKSIPSILQNLWDNELKESNLMIILCGSAMSFMEKEVLSEKSPLYGRATGIYKLEEMDFFTSKEFLKALNIEEKIIAYSCLGGVPHYLNQFDNDRDLSNNIKQNMLKKGSILYNEVEFLMKQELRETSIYYSLIEAIALGNTKLNDIYNKTLIEKTKISVYLKNLIDLNIIQKEYPVTIEEKKKANIQNGIYKLKNNYFKFYFRFIFPNLSELEFSDVEGIYEEAVKPFLNEYTSFIFEDVCIQYMRILNKNKELPIRFIKIGRWWNKKDEIDIVAFDLKGGMIFGECKWKNSKVGIKELNNLIEKSLTLGEKIEERYYFLFSKSGFDEELSMYVQNNKRVKLISTKDM